MIKSDITIIGAGPAGTTAAIALAKKGIPSLLLDKHHFPRQKICGDGLSGKAVSTLNRLDPGYVAELSGSGLATGSFAARFYSPNLKMMELSFQTGQALNPPGLICRRIDFDHFLLKKALDLKEIKFEGGIQIDSMTRENGQIILRNKVGRIIAETRLVIFAAGSNRKLIRQIHPEYPGSAEEGIGVRGYFENVSGSDHKHAIEIHFLKELLPWYLWIFPFDDGSANVGLALPETEIKKQQLSLKDLLLHLLQSYPHLKNRFKNGKLNGKIEANRLPYYTGPCQVSGDNFLLVGDAARLIDPFTFENIDHFTTESMNLEGEFTGGNILKPTRENLVIKENNSLGFDMDIPEEGIDVYEEKGMLFDSISLSNDGLVGIGTLNFLTSTIKSKEIRMYPDSVIVHADTFSMEKDDKGLFPELESKDVSIKWFTNKGELTAKNNKGENFFMFNNETQLDGNLKLTRSSLTGSGIINTPESRITSNNLSFTSGSIRADTSDYYLKSASTGGYTFIAENAAADVNFDLRTASFHLNTDTSMVKFPEIQYICTMTDFVYNMDTKVLNMEQKGRSDRELLSRDRLIRLDFNNLDKPTFFATNVIGDTLAFSSWKGSYHLEEEYIEAENVNYIHIADALIQP
ncbi:MAG: NAD(P)-binding protein, partial [Bacteroidales bacterium]|nr:NAD(P)-binding protein [Bacteroidales bacterium]